MSFTKITQKYNSMFLKTMLSKKQKMLMSLFHKNSQKYKFVSVTGNTVTEEKSNVDISVAEEISPE